MKKKTLFDCNLPYCDRNFVWSAILRVRDLNSIIYFEHSENEVKRMEVARRKQYLNFQIENYKKQDLEADRDIKYKDYIDVEWLIDQMHVNTHCKLCMNKYYCVLDQHKDVMCNIIVDRLQNDEIHAKENCHLLCCLYNCSKR